MIAQEDDDLQPMRTHCERRFLSRLGARWRAYENGAPVVFITGEGTYRVGGEFAVTQEMNLDLSINGPAPERLHSGIVAGPADPPRLDITFNGDGAIGSQDLFDYLTAFFGGCG